MKCPKCGYMRQGRDDAFVPASECPSCGIVYSKHDTIAAPTRSPLSAPQTPHLRPSAVDPESLKKARERVEKRLRQRMEARTRDDRYEQTLEIAKKITNDSIHNGQDPVLQALEQKMADTPIDPSDDATVETDDPVLLEEMVGVQLHTGTDNDASNEEGKTKKTEENSLADASGEASTDQEQAPEEAEPVSKDADAVEMAPDADESDETETESLEVEAVKTKPAASEPEVIEPATEPLTQSDNDYPEDVRVETVVLTSQLETTDLPQQAGSEPQTPTDEPPSVDEEIDLPEAYIAEASNATRFGANLTRLLPMVAWLILITGLVGAVLSWTTISEVEAGINVAASDQKGTALPLGLLLGFAYLATGALGFAFFWVSSMINRQLKDIREILLVHPGSAEKDAPGPDDLSQ